MNPSYRDMWEKALGWSTVVCGAVGIGFGFMLLLGGMARVITWLLIPIVLPVLGIVVLVVAGITGLVSRRFGRTFFYATSVASVSIASHLFLVVSFSFPASLDTTTPSATVRLPSDATLAVAQGGHNSRGNHHTFTPDQRWAYDLVVAPYLTGSTDLTDYGSYGISVLAPIDGEIVIAHDGEPDMTPGVRSDETLFGNHVAIKMETGTYLLIAHLKKGSVTVSEGDRVVEGQPIAECGNSGGSDEPHIHIHHQRQLPKDGLFVNFAEGLPLFFRDHDGPPMPEGGIEERQGARVLLGPTLRHLGGQDADDQLPARAESKAK